MELRIELNASWLETGFDLISLKIDSSRHQSRVLNLKLNLINPVSMPLTLIIKHSPNPAFVFVSCLILLTYCYNNSFDDLIISLLSFHSSFMFFIDSIPAYHSLIHSVRMNYRKRYRVCSSGSKFSLFSLRFLQNSYFAALIIYLIRKNESKDAAVEERKTSASVFLPSPKECLN